MTSLLKSLVWIAPIAVLGLLPPPGSHSGIPTQTCPSACDDAGLRPIDAGPIGHPEHPTPHEAQPGNPSTEPTSAASTSAVDSHWKVFVDPVSGKVLPGPPPAAQTVPLNSPLPGAAPSLSTTVREHREIPGTTKAGGFKVDLGDGFFHRLNARVDAQSAPRVQCDHFP